MTPIVPFTIVTALITINVNKKETLASMLVSLFHSLPLVLPQSTDTKGIESNEYLGI